MIIIKYIGEKSGSFEPTERKFVLIESDNLLSDFSLVYLTDNYRAVRHSAGWSLISPTGKRVAVNGYLEVS
jgi:hypothetical protein